MAKTDLASLSIPELGSLFRSGKLSPVELTQHFLARIDRRNPELNAYLTVTPELALVQARQAEKELGHRKSRNDRGALHGIPISLKDNIHTAGIRTTAGAKFLKDFVPEKDARLVAKLKTAGAILLGKTNLHEFAYGVTTNNPHYGPTRNPWDANRIPGGSSGGAAAAVAAGLCVAAIGTDTGGSIRIPASLCGAVGFKPALRSVSVDGVIPLSPTLDCAGSLARSVEDAALVFSAIQPHTKGAAPKSFTKKKSVLGIPKEFFFDMLSPETSASFESALKLLRKAGYEMKEISIPLLNNTENAGNNIAWAEATHYHQKMGWFPKHAADYGEDVRARLEIGARVSATAYLEAMEQREAFIQQFDSALAETKIDALIVPTTPIAAPLIGEESTTIAGKDHATRALLLRLNRPANLAGVPAISIPCGLTASGLPIGLQLIGRSQLDSSLLALAGNIEKLLPAIGNALDA
ncbi:MAG: Asp-tRNA(Asn)/Glu-tRNA(Gln) amidotransferase subunit GatA [Acidobacteria bacterium]|nr:Asp-tRNA(Asn)/Glu-tRNA(Gln) amidotransferase subunit GatA [Acidobacteriota bacterium]MBS1866439.1 Asp-tRNA(Asn)/Glu-tRNA(Gln) amidotransferase subunit GatA [Acidobacteriota bacterium]